MSIPMRIPEGKIILTYEDYAALPNDGKRYEILEGELSTTLVPSTRHQMVSGNLLVCLTEHIQEHDLGRIFIAPLAVILESTSVVEPDLLFVSKARQKIITDRAVEGSPDLIIEIVSPATARNDRVTKAQIYARHKVPAYWIVDPEQGAVEVYLLNVDSYRLAVTLQGETPLPVPPFADLEFAAKDLFI